jgi:hypothetical protein
VRVAWQHPETHRARTVSRTALARRRVTLALAASALLLGGCIPLPGGYVLSRKTVVAKEGDATLVADDGSRCRIPQRSFVEVQTGDEHTCAWNEGSDAGRTPGRVPAPAFPRPTLPPPSDGAPTG